jgi:hypothetical protein
MEAQPNGARKKRPCAKVGNLKIAIPYFVVWATSKRMPACVVREPLTRTPAARNALCLIAADPAHAWR